MISHSTSQGWSTQIKNNTFSHILWRYVSSHTASFSIIWPDFLKPPKYNRDECNPMCGAPSIEKIQQHLPPETMSCLLWVIRSWHFLLELLSAKDRFPLKTVDSKLTKRFVSANSQSKCVTEDHNEVNNTTLQCLAVVWPLYLFIFGEFAFTGKLIIYVEVDRKQGKIEKLINMQQRSAAEIEPGMLRLCGMQHNHLTIGF